MKGYLVLLLALMLSMNSGCKSGKTEQKPDQKDRIEQLKNEVSADLTENLLPWWSSKTVDYINGGFYGRVNSHDSVIADADKGGILNARILWTYSSAYRITKDTSYLRLATRAKDYILKYFIDKEYGGAYFSITAKGEPKNALKQTYTNAFFIYGLSEYSRATGDKEALDAAKVIFELFEKHVLDTEANGYFEVFSRDWKRVREKMIGESSDNDEKTMNTSLHLMEAYACLYRVWPDPRMAERLRNMVEIFLDKIIDKNTYHLINFMDRNWNRTSQVDSYGHDIECSWLLHEAASLLGDEQLLKRVEQTSVKMAETVIEAIQPDGSIVYEKDLATGHVQTGRSWWAQVETIVGYFNAWEISGDERFLEYSINCWNYTRDHFVDKSNGGWFPNVKENGEPGRGDKAGHWICPYHNGRMCMEIIERFEKLQHENHAARDEKDILLKDYKPVSIYKIPVTEVPVAKYKACDMHTHVYAKDKETIKKWVKAMDDCGIEKSIVLTGATGARFDSVYDLYSDYKDRFEIWCGFDYKGFDEPGYGPAAVKELERCVKKGARGVGEVMFKGKAVSARSREKSIRLPDDPRFDALFEKCADLKIPVNIHISEDKWMYENIDAHNDGLMNAATWHISTADGSKSHEEMLERFGNTLRKHPKTIFVAAHLLNCCADLSYLGNYFDSYPSLYADISARFGEIAPIPKFAGKFIEKYADRIVYGTDMTFNERIYHVTFRILETSDEHFYETDLFGYHWPLYGLGLSDQALRKIYSETPKKIISH